VKYGVELPNGCEYGDPRTLADLAQLAERSGWDGIFLEDYIVWQSHQDVPTYDPWVALAAMAMRTERIRLGTEVTPLARRRPWKLARETVTLDHLSNGRLILGVGLGDAKGDISFTHFGEETDDKRRAGMLDEALDVLVGLWSGQPFSYDGAFYHVKQVTLLPTPVQKPRIPIWVGGGYPLKGPTERAARWDGSCLYKYTPNSDWEDMAPDDVRALKALVASRRNAATPFDIVLGGRHRADDWSHERAHMRAVAEAGATWWIEYLPPELGGLEQIRACIERGPLRIE
jgi:alkanesulfonate monooxygenase SsuD/methylene tetrahydromethanopterin reductase-like flavin-dependent oxidoreductase (luciferase family)